MNIKDTRRISIMDNEVNLNENFEFYMTTRLDNPKFSSEVSSKIILLNFTSHEPKANPKEQKKPMRCCFLML